MSDPQKIEVKTEFDVFMARMQVRNLARAIGFDITSQARVALATSSLARALRLGDTYCGYVLVNGLRAEGRSGVQVCCKVFSVDDFEIGSRALADVKWLVDELTIEELPSNDLQVTMVKWMV